MTVTFEVLAEDNRRRILDLLVEEERPVGELVGILDLSQPAVSKHLKVLRVGGAGRHPAPRRSAGSTACGPEPLREVDDWLAPYRLLWAEHLSALERHLEIMGDSDGEPWA